MAKVTAGATKPVFLVDQSGLPKSVGGNPPFPTNPVHAEPLHEAGLTLGGPAYNVLCIAALNGEVYA